jgi:predicted RNA-binding Zn ribbon-like protein
MATYADVHHLPLLGGHPVLDLVDTVEPRLPGVAGHDHLRTDDDVVVLATRSGLLTPQEGEEVRSAWAAAASTSGRVAVLELRDLVGEVLDDLVARRPPTRLDELRLRWADAAGRALLVPSAEWVDPAQPARTGAILVVGPDPTTRLLDRWTFAAVELVTSADVDRLHACPPPDGGCGWLFLDRSRNGTRRWCSMADCGTRAKSRRLTARRRESRPAADLS